MRLTYSPEDEAFRAELVGWLEEHPPPPAGQQEQRLSSAHMPAWAAEWQRTLFDHGWLVPGWPPELGGRDATAVQQMIYFEEFSDRDVPRSFNPQGLSIITPSILDHGTEEQKERWAIPTLKAEVTWCLGMSEPDAGSDLASLQTRAVLATSPDGRDCFVVNGQKVWTSGAHHADYCFCFVRTDPDAPKHRGISVLVIDMKTPGIETRPLPELTSPDYADFNEVFFTDVVVPAENLVGELHGGWPITRGSLVHERRMLWISSSNGLQRAVDALIELGHERGFYDDARFRDAVAGYFVDAQAAMLMGYRGFAKSTRGKEPHEHSLLKLFGSEVEQRLCLTAHEWLGADGIDRSVEAEPIWRTGSWAEQWMRSFAGTVAGGTSEIQRNILAERVLGLPRG